MSKVTSKLQVTIPKAIAERYSIAPGDEVEWVAAPDSVHVVPLKSQRSALTTASRLKLFDAATERQKRREQEHPREHGRKHDRGWSREELYQRGGSR